jgi:exodeoxyribonuclease VIII
MNHVSLDLETLGTRFDAPILSVGAVVFDMATGKTGTTFYREVTLKSAVAAGVPDGDTLQWWLQRGDVAKAMFAPDNPDTPRKWALATVMQEFGTWFRSAGTGPCKVWGNGASFDVTLVEHAIAKGCVGLSPPWHYMNIRDLRTLVDAAEVITGFDRKSVARVGTHHNALDDAIYQAHLASAAWRALAGAKTKASVKPVTKPVEQAEDW